MTSEQNHQTNASTINLFRYRCIGACVCVVAVILCLTYAQIRSELTGWWKEHAGGAPYVFFWAAFGFMVFPRPRWLIFICAAATIGTCLVEFMQLWQPDWLMRIRSTKFGAALLGSGFTWQDFPPYFLGGLMGYSIIRFATQKFALIHTRQAH